MACLRKWGVETNAPYFLRALTTEQAVPAAASCRETTFRTEERVACSISHVCRWHLRSKPFRKCLPSLGEITALMRCNANFMGLLEGFFRFLVTSALKNL